MLPDYEFHKALKYKTITHFLFTSLTILSKNMFAQANVNTLKLQYIFSKFFQFFKEYLKNRYRYR